MSTTERPRRPGQASRSNGDDVKQQRRADILAAAKVAFAGKGFHGTKMSDVADAAGISYGSVYWYFESKDELFHALMDDQERALREHIERAVGSMVLDGSRDGEALFRRSVQATFEFFESDRDTVKLLFRDSLVLGDRFDRHLVGIYEGFIADIEKSITAAQATGHVIDAPPRMVAFTVAALIGQMALRRLSTDDGVSAAVVADFIVTVLLDGLRPREGTT